LSISGRDAVQFLTAEALDVGCSVSMVLAKLFLGDADLGNRVWHVVGREKLEHGERRSSICIAPNELCNTEVSQTTF